MKTATTVALRTVIVLALIGSLGVQTVLMPVIWADLERTDDVLRGSFIVILIAIVVTMQICAVCVWQLLSLVRRDRVFSPAAFRYVDVIFAAVALASVLTFAIAVLLAPGGAAPGIVGLVCGAALVTAGVALIVLVLRAVLAQAVASRTEVENLRTELSEVV